MDKTEMLYELCEVLTDELETVRDKINKSGMNAGELEVVDKLAHALKSLKTIMAMGDDYSNNSYNNSYNRRSYNRGRSNQRNQSYQRRYSREYSYADDMDGVLDDMREMLPELPEEKRRKAERLIDELAR